MTNSKTGLRFKATRGSQGGRDFITATMDLDAFAETFHVDAAEIARELDEYRLVDDKHADDIAAYLFEDGWVLPGIVIAVDAPWTWEPVTDQDGQVLDEDLGYATLPLDARKSIRDGVHRSIGIRRGIRLDEDGMLRGHSIAVMVYVEPNADRRRQMLTDINFNAKAVTKSKSISFDTRSPYSVALNKHLLTHKLLDGLVETEQSRVLKRSRKLFTLAAVRDAVERIIGYPKTPPPVDVIVAEATKFFDLLWNARPEFHKISADPTSVAAARRETLLASSTTLRVIASAVARARNDGIDEDRIQGRLATISFDPADDRWIGCGFVTRGATTPSSRTQEMAAAVRALYLALIAQD